jgi:hypothetical protein
MSNHGVVAYGSDVEQAYMKMETVEHFAKIALVTHQLGHQQPLGAAEVEKLVVVRAKYRGGMEPPAPAGGNHHKKGSTVESELDVVTQRRVLR